jgi:hypothetical protein
MHRYTRTRDRAFTDELRAGEHEKRTMSVTALRDWLPIRPIDLTSLKAFVWDAIRGLTAEEPATAAEPPLMGRGLERC